MVSIFRVVKHCFNKFIYIKEPLNNFHAIMRMDGKTHFPCAFQIIKALVSPRSMINLCKDSN